MEEKDAQDECYARVAWSGNVADENLKVCVIPATQHDQSHRTNR